MSILLRELREGTNMYELPKDGFFPKSRTDIRISGRPTSMPTVPEGQCLVCEYIRSPEVPSLNRFFRIDTVEDMQQLYDGYSNGGAVSLSWFFCPGDTFILESFSVEPRGKQD